MFRRGLCMLASCCLLLVPSPGRAQTTFGSITGTVTDPSGLAVPGAVVRVTNAGTGAVRQVTTGSTGVFRVPSLDVGAYSLTVGAKGFTTYSASNLNLTANEVMNVDVHLTIGAAATVVQVQGGAPTIDTATSDISDQMSNTAVEQLPLESRHDGGTGGIYTVATMQAGTGKQSTSSIPVIQGARLETGTLPTMDGIAVMAYIQGAGPVQPSMDSIQEVKEEDVDAPAEYATAANIEVVTHGGTNKTHGTAYYDYNGNALNARNFFASTVPFRVYNNYAISVGGPIIKNKLFYFADYEGSREAAESVVTESVPLQAWRNGDFSSLLPKTQLVNPLTGAPFAGNIIPSNLISTVSQNIQSYAYPLPNTGASGVVSNNWTAAFPGNTGFTHYDDVTGRVDYNPTSKDSLFTRLSWRRLPLLAVGVPYPLKRDQLRRSKSGVVSWSHTFAPTVLNEFRFGATFHDNHYTANVLGTSLLSQFGITGITTAPDYLASAPYFNISGVTAWNPGASSFTYEDNAEPDFEWIDDLSWTRGRHFMKFGFDAIRDRLGGNNLNANLYGEYDFTGVETNFGYADFLMGIPQTTELAAPPPGRDLRGSIYALYAQDEFRVSPSLTLNYGVRWELEMPYTSNTGIIYNFDPRNGDLVIPNNGVKLISPDFPTNIPIITASQAGFPANGLLNFNKRNIEPRVGFAYKLFGSDKTVLRGGYGIYSNLIYGGLARFEMSGGPFSSSVQYINSITGGVPLFSFPSPFLTTGTTSTQAVLGVNPNLKTPYTQQWNVTLERQLGQFGLRVSYIGSRSDQLVLLRNLDEPAPSLTAFSVGERPYSLYSSVDYNDSGGNEFYNALEVELKKNFGRNLTMDASWTWAKDLTDTQDTGVTGQLIQNQYDRAVEKTNNPLTAPNRIVAYALYNLPVGHGQHFLSNAHGAVQGILGGWRTTWTVILQSGEYFSPSFSGFDPSNTGVFGGLPDRVPGVALYPANRTVSDWFNPNAFKVPGCPDSNPVCAAGAQTNLGRFGNAAYDTLTGPPLRNLDFGLFKEFHIGEHVQTQLIMSMANALNHPNFGLPAGNISTPATVNVLSSEIGAQLVEPGPREIDFALRMQF